MHFLNNHSPASTPAASTAEAADRILDMLKLAVENRQEAPGKGSDTWVDKMYVRLISAGSQLALVKAYQEITGELPPEEFRVENDPDLAAFLDK